MKRIINTLPLIAVFATILIGSATVGAIARDGQPSDSPRGLRRMLQTFDAPNIAKVEIKSAARQVSNTRFQ